MNYHQEILKMVFGTTSAVPQKSCVYSTLLTETSLMQEYVHLVTQEIWVQLAQQHSI